MSIESKTSIKQALQEMSPRGASIAIGTVKSTLPLRIQVAGDEKLLISSNAIIVPQSLTDYDVQIGDETLTVHNALSVGDEVHLLCLNHKTYYVLDRT